MDGTPERRTNLGVIAITFVIDKRAFPILAVPTRMHGRYTDDELVDDNVSDWWVLTS